MFILNAATLNPKKTPYLDFVRTFAILMVILLHSIHNYLPAQDCWGRPLWWVLGYVNELARTGVPLFFMISGYLLIGSEGTSDIKNFYKRRFGKLLPSFILYSIFYYAGYGIYHGKQLSLLGFLSEFFYEGTAYHLWFMYSLMMLYLFVPFLKLMLDRCSLKYAFFFFLLTIFPSTLRPFINILLDERLSVLLASDGFSGYVGYMILGYILGKYNCSTKLRLGIYTLAMLGLAVFPYWNLSMTLDGGTQFFFNGGYTINHYLLASAIFLFCKHDLPERAMKPGILAPLSFQAYLSHAFILDLVQIPFQTFRPSIYMGLSFLFAAVLSFLWGGFILYGKHLIHKRHPFLFKK